MIVLWVLGGMACWTAVWLLCYHLFEKKHDASGDGGLAMGFIAIAPWLVVSWPFFALWENLPAQKREKQKALEAAKRWGEMEKRHPEFTVFCHDCFDEGREDVVIGNMLNDGVPVTGCLRCSTCFKHCQCDD